MEYIVNKLLGLRVAGIFIGKVARTECIWNNHWVGKSASPGYLGIRHRDQKCLG